MHTPQQHGDHQGEDRLKVEQQRAGGGGQARQTHHQGEWPNNTAQQGDGCQRWPVLPSHGSFGLAAPEQTHR